MRRSKGAWVAIAVLAGWTACQGKLFSITVEESDTVTVARGTVLEDLLVDIGFGDFVTMDLTQSEEIRNQDVAPGDIRDVRLTVFELEAVAPAAADLSFIEDMAIYVEAPGLPRQLLAWQDDFPKDQALVPFEIEDLDLTDYVVSEAMTLTTEVEGRRPKQDTKVEARFAVKVGVTGRGACNQRNRGR